MMTRRPTPTQWVLIVALALPAVVVGGVANGYWSSGGGGAGSAGTGTAELVSLSNGNPSDALFPGHSSDLSVTVTNPNSYAVHLSTLALDTSRGTGGLLVDASHASCLPGVLSFATQSNGGTGWTISADGTAALHLPNAVTMAIGASNACQDADFNVYLVATS